MEWTLQSVYRTIVRPISLGSFKSFVCADRSLNRSPLQELLDGWTGTIIREQPLFNLLDGMMIVLALITINFIHPGPLLVRRCPDCRPLVCDSPQSPTDASIPSEHAQPEHITRHEAQAQGQAWRLCGRLVASDALSECFVPEPYSGACSRLSDPIPSFLLRFHSPHPYRLLFSRPIAISFPGFPCRYNDLLTLCSRVRRRTGIAKNRVHLVRRASLRDRQAHLVVAR